MHRFIIIFLLILSFSLPLSADSQETAVSFSVSADVMAIDALWRDHAALRLSLGADLGDGIAISLPVSCTFDRSGGNEVLLDVALSLLVSPWITGPYIGITLTQIALFIGPYIPQQPIHYLHELVFGYRWEVLPGFFIRPSLVYREPADENPDSFSYVSALVPTRRRLQFCLDIGWVFSSIQPGGIREKEVYR
jgi:hypothetical protein